MQLDRPPQHHRREHVALELLHRDGDADDDQRRHHALADQRDQRGDQPGEEGADDREEGAEEHQERQRNRQGNPDDRKPDADEQAVDQPDRRHAPEIGAEGVEGPPPHLAKLAAVRPGVALEPVADAVAVLDEEEGQHDRQQRRGDHLGRHGGAGEHAPGQRGRVGLGLLARPLQQPGELGVGEVQRALPQPALHVVEAGADLAAEGAELWADLRRQHRNRRGDQRHARQDHRPGGGERRPATLAEPVGRGCQQRGQEQRDDHRQDDQPQVHQQEAHDPDGGGDHQQPPAQRGRARQPGWNPRRLLLVHRMGTAAGRTALDLRLGRGGWALPPGRVDDDLVRAAYRPRIHGYHRAERTTRFA